MSPPAFVAAGAMVIRRNTLDPALYGVSGLTTTAHYKTASPGGEQGLAAGNGGFGWGVMGVVDSQAGASQMRYLMSTYDGGTGNGYFTRTKTTNASIEGIYGLSPSGSGGTPNGTIAAGDVGKVFLAIVAIDSSNAPSLYYNRSLVGTLSSVSYAVPSSGDRATYLGYRSGVAQSSDGLTLLGGFTFRGSPTLADFQAYYDAVKTGVDLQTTMANATLTHLWSVKRDQAGSAPGTLTDQVGSDAMTKQGSPSFVTIGTPSWGW